MMIIRAERQYITKMRMRLFAIATALSFGVCVMGLVAPASASEIFDSPLSSPGYYNGTGGINSGFTVLTATESDGSTLQLGLEAGIRYSGPVTPNGIDYTVPTGTGTGGDALWNLNYSVFTGTDPTSAYTYDFTVTDLNTGKVATYDPSNTALGNAYWAGANNAGAGGAETSVAAGADGFQNSENLSFGFLASQMGFNPNSTDTYLVTLSATPDFGTALDPSVTIEVTPSGVSPVPEPKSIMFMGVGLLGIVALARRKKMVAVPQ